VAQVGDHAQTGELVEDDRDVDQKAERLWIGESKTDAGVREIPLPKRLSRELAVHQEWSRFGGPDDLVFCTRNGKPLGKDNTRQRVLAKAAERADGALVKAGYPPLPEGLKQRSLRHTYISLRVAIGHDLATVSQDAGHADLAVTYRVYTHAMRLSEAAREHLCALWDGAEWAPLGTSAQKDEERSSSEVPNSAL
jgi:integrase